MPRPLAFVVFIALVLSITAGMHAYVWLRLVRDAALPALWTRGLTVLFGLLFLSLPLTVVLSHSLPPDRGRLLLLCLFAWFGILFLLVMLCSVADLAQLGARLVAMLGAHRPPRDPERRVVLARLIAGGVALVAGGATVGGVRSALARVGVREVPVRLGRLPAALDGTTIVQLTDLHLGPTLRRDFVEEVVATVNELAPDVVALTGDLADGTPDQLRSLVEPLRGLRARHGVYFVTGNHEYYSGVDAWCKEVARLGVRVLRNERVTIGTDDAGYELCGVDDFDAARRGGQGADLARALAGRDPSRETVLLAHQPRAVHEASAAGIGLVLSGHTHGGQIWPWGLFVRLQQPAVRGLHRFGNTQLYVSCGTGFWGPPLRLGAPAEITKIVLRAG